MTQALCFVWVSGSVTPGERCSRSLEIQADVICAL